MASGATVTPAVNQIEINPFLYRRKTIAFFEAHGVKMQAYRALRDGKAFEDATVLAVAAKHARSAAQVIVRWLTVSHTAHRVSMARSDRR